MEKTNSWGRAWKKHFSLTFKRDEFLMEGFLNEKVDPISYIKELILKDMNLIKNNDIKIIFNKDIMYFAKENDNGLVLIKIEKNIENNEYDATLYSTYALSNNEYESMLSDDHSITFEEYNILYDNYKSKFI